mgnify:CR=1 FL=1
MAKAKQYTATITLPDGGRKYFRSTDKEELARKVEEAKQQLGLGINIADNTTVAQLAQLWFDTCKKPYLRPTSAETLKNTINSYVLQPFISCMFVRDVRPVHTARAMANLSKYSRSIQSKAYHTFVAIFRFAVDNRLIMSVPLLSTTKPGGAPAEEKEPLTPEQSLKLLRATEGTRAHLFCAIALGAGLRREEILGLMWSDVDLDRGYLYVRHANPLNKGSTGVTSELKTKAANRDIPIAPWLVEELRTARSASSSLYVMSSKLGGPVTPSSFKSMWHTVTMLTTDDPSLLGQPVDKRHPQFTYQLDFYCHPHLLRHTCITRWVEAGLDIKEIQYLAGHATVEMTLRVYAHYQRSVRAEETAKKIQQLAVGNA